ncbi:MAG TPA: helix-turn-helix transcriptional regulator [Candidatus Acidoferrales bacterium]|nr:helix-turn-helix transcriptional regulator [Candidatus Acidoferrales bacterium]
MKECLDVRLHPGLLPQEKEKRLPPFWNMVRRDWLEVSSRKQRSSIGYSLSLGRVALLGIAQRQISIKFSPKTRKQNTTKPLPTSIKTLGDLIQVKRVERNLTPGYLAAKMGIAANLVRSWEDGTSKPDNGQLEVLVGLLGLDAGDWPFK